MTLEAISGFTVHEFRLHADVDRATVQRDLNDLDREACVPVLTRIDDTRALAVVRAHHSGDPLAADDGVRAVIDRAGNGVCSREFRPRVALAEPDAGSHFRLAVTEFGRNDATPDAPDTWIAADAGRADADSQLLWIGLTADSAEGLFVLVGHDVQALPAEPPGPPIPFGNDIGVRIYTGTRM